MFNLTTITPI